MLRGEAALYLMRHYRRLWIEGRYGGFKTALAVRFALELLERGWVKQCCTNFPCAIATRAADVQSMKDTVVIFDEAGDWMTDEMFRGAAAALRKLNLIIIMPSIEEPPLKARRLKCQMTLDLNATLVPALHYVVGLDYGKVKDKHSLWWYNPQEVFGLYDTTAFPRSSDGLLKLIRYEVSKLPGASETEEEVSEWNSTPVAGGTGLRDLAALRGYAETFYEAAQKYEEALSLDRDQGGKRRRK